MSLRLAYASLLACTALLCAQASSAHAQVVVVRLDPAAEGVSQMLESGLARWSVVPDIGYFAEAQRRGLDPSSDVALRSLIPPLQARLALVPRAGSAESVRVEFRDGSSGSSLGDASIPLEAGALEEEGQLALEREVGRRLGAPPTAADGGASAEDGAPPPSEDAMPLVRVYGGAGVGTRSFEWPGSGRRLAVDTGLFAALELGMRFLVGWGNALALGPAFAYQTSIAQEVEEKHLAGQSDTLRIRSHRLDATFVVQIGPNDGFQVTPGVGFATHNLRPEVHHLRTPSYSIAGPVLRIAFRIPIGPVALRIAPEAQLLFTDDPLVEVGVDGAGPAFGGELALEVPLVRKLTLEVTARDLRAWLPSREGSKATDTGLFATTRLVWQP
jgi:hypothetical protein